VYREYLDVLMGVNEGAAGQCLLNDGALIVVDNTLWKGLVLGEVR
jgi:predicted O-methyltransferase YrrM